MTQRGGHFYQTTQDYGSLKQSNKVEALKTQSAIVKQNPINNMVRWFQIDPAIVINKWEPLDPKETKQKLPSHWSG